MPGKKGLIIGVPVVLVILGGGFYGAAVTGFVKVPGITPKSKLKAANMYGENKLYGEPKEKPIVLKPKKSRTAARPAPTPKPTHTIDPVKGASAVAEVWNGLEATQLTAIVKDWRDEDLAVVMANMDTAKAAELLAGLEPKRASKVSQELEEYASRVPIKN